jgi:hypothetical protein
VTVHDDPAQLAQRLGLRVAEAMAAVQVKAVLRGGAAERAGLSRGRRMAGRGSAGKAGWRLGKLDDLLFYAGTHKSVTALVARDKRLLRLSLTLPAAAITWRLACVTPRCCGNRGSPRRTDRQHRAGTLAVHAGCWTGWRASCRGPIRLLPMAKPVFTRMIAAGKPRRSAAPAHARQAKRPADPPGARASRYQPPHSHSEKQTPDSACPSAPAMLASCATK